MRLTLVPLFVVSLLPLACGLKLGGGELPVNSDGLQPLGVGKSWTYSVSQINSSTQCGSGNRTVTQTINTKGSLAGQTAYNLSALCPGQAEQQLAFDGQRVLVYASNQWMPALDTPPVDGHAWPSDQRYYWSYAGTVSVSAGKFTNCWTRQVDQTNNNIYQTFCPGVGKVVDHSEQGGVGYHAQLTHWP
jgi:hypothetical protein